MRNELIGYQEALKLTLEHISPLAAEEISLVESTDYVLANDVYSLVDSPSIDASLKDGFAVRSSEIAAATPANPVRLKVAASAAAGLPSQVVVKPGTTVQILTGAQVPQGADAVVSEEFTHVAGDHVIITNHAEPGRNILPKGSDVAQNQITIPAGNTLTPGKVGILAAAGYATVPVVRKPEIAIIATGDEVLAPGQPLTEGKLFASNLVTLHAWCRRYGMQTTLDIVGDEPTAIMEKLDHAVTEHNAVLTSGGAWTGDRDLVVRMLSNLGWQKMYHRVRIGPGKAVGFGLLQGTPVFVLPGGPPSNLMAFLQLALPGLLKLVGEKDPHLPERVVRLTAPARGHSDWTQFIFGRFKPGNGNYCFCPIKGASRLKSMAEAEGIISIPEGVEHIPAGADVAAQMLA
jgi:molybdopterin molybdotransferase